MLNCVGLRNCWRILRLKMQTCVVIGNRIGGAMIITASFTVDVMVWAVSLLHDNHRTSRKLNNWSQLSLLLWETWFRYVIEK